MSELHTSLPFTLPLGYTDETGTTHTDGEMRLATAADEILPLRDPRVQSNPAYLAIIVLARVITRLGSMSAITPKVVEGLFAADLTFLQELYNQANDTGRLVVPAVCPRCDHQFEAALEAPGKSIRTPATASSRS
jgi:hypothetical protein